MIATVYTIGHSTHSIERFLDLLRMNSIEVVADVRSVPMSRYSPQFSRDELRGHLSHAQIKYVFLGKELGARSDETCCYVDGKAEYNLIASTEAFMHGIERVIEGSKTYRIALMCSEKEPLECHRTILVSRHLETAGLKIQHILSDGKTEQHRATMKRLVRLLALPEPDMFHTEDDVISDAYRVQGDAIAYRRDTTRASVSSKAAV